MNIIKLAEIRVTNPNTSTPIIDIAPVDVSIPSVPKSRELSETMQITIETKPSAAKIAESIVYFLCTVVMMASLSEQCLGKLIDEVAYFLLVGDIIDSVGFALNVNEACLDQH